MFRTTRTQFCIYFPLFLFLLTFLTTKKTVGQTVDTGSFNQPVTLDEVVVRAKENGFDVKNFIHLIKEDTTFYKAFKSLHLHTFNAINQIKVYNKKGTKVVASQNSETKQIYRNGCRTMNTLYENTTGNFYKANGDYRYYTMQLFASLFFTKGKVCGENNIVKGALENETLKGNRLEKSITQLKFLIFLPGRAVPGVPFIGDKVAIFDPEVAKDYNFNIKAETRKGIPCFVFEATPKPERKNKVVIKTFKTWLRQSDYAIMAQEEALNYRNLLFDFDVKLYVDLSKIKGQLLPTYISYDGNWHIALKKREIVKFTANFSY